MPGPYSLRKRLAQCQGAGAVSRRLTASPHPLERTHCRSYHMEKASLHRRERSAGRFDRAVTIPARIDADRVKADYHDEFLALYLPRAEQDKPRAIKIA